MSDMDRTGGRVAVIGAGTMGHGIAQVAAMAGYDVCLYDIAEGPLESAMAEIRRNLDAGVKRGKVDAGTREAALERLSTTTELAVATGSAGLVIEAAPESLELKREIFKQLDAACAPDVTLATNTSSLSVSEIAAATERPGRVVGMHFFNPVHIMKLLEVVRGDATDDAAIDAARAAGIRMGKTPIVVTDSPGFASSRLGVALGLEAMRMVEEGVASAEDIDTAMELGYRHPMGPLKLTDLVGLDVRLAIARYMQRETGSDRFKPPAVLERMVAEGKLGKKSGEGFYKWKENREI